MTYLANRAAEIVDEVMAKGSDKDGQAHAWRFKSPSYHMSKAAGHLYKAMLMYGKIIPEDDEGVLVHFRHAMVRVIMTIAILEAM